MIMVIVMVVVVMMVNKAIVGVGDKKRYIHICWELLLLDRCPPAAAHHIFIISMQHHADMMALLVPLLVMDHGTYS